MGSLCCLMLTTDLNWDTVIFVQRPALSAPISVHRSPTSASCFPSSSCKHIGDHSYRPLAVSAPHLASLCSSRSPTRVQVCWQFPAGNTSAAEPISLESQATSHDGTDVRAQQKSRRFRSHTRVVYVGQLCCRTVRLPATTPRAYEIK